MAKVTGPLMSIEASGQFAKSITFDKRGFARGYTIPTNPRTENQQATRLAMKAAQTAAKHLNETARATLSAALGYRWNANLLAEALGLELANWTASLAAYTALLAGDKSTVDAAAQDANMPDTIQVPEYTPTITGAQAIFAIFHAYNQLISPNIAIADIGTLFE